MKTPRLVPGLRRDWQRRLAWLALVPLLVVGLLLASVALPPVAAPAHALNAPAATPLAPTSAGVNGTLASFTALFPELETVFLPSIVR